MGRQSFRGKKTEVAEIALANGRASESARKALEEAERPWEAAERASEAGVKASGRGVGGRDGKTERIEHFSLCGGAMDIVPYGAAAQKWIECKRGPWLFQD